MVSYVYRLDLSRESMLGVIVQRNAPEAESVVTWLNGATSKSLSTSGIERVRYAASQLVAPGVVNSKVVLVYGYVSGGRKVTTPGHAVKVCSIAELMHA